MSFDVFPHRYDFHLIRSLQLFLANKVFNDGENVKTGLYHFLPQVVFITPVCNVSWNFISDSNIQCIIYFQFSNFHKHYAFIWLHNCLKESGTIKQNNTDYASKKGLQNLVIKRIYNFHPPYPKRLAGAFTNRGRQSFEVYAVTMQQSKVLNCLCVPFTVNPLNC